MAPFDEHGSLRAGCKYWKWLTFLLLLNDYFLWPVVVESLLISWNNVRSKVRNWFAFRSTNAGKYITARVMQVVIR